MKAIVMAGGEGTRLRPLTSNTPKPMVKIMDRPVLEHIVSLLRKNGISDICMTLRYMPEKITEYFKDGSDFGVNITYSIESSPLGTAGSVKNCADFIGNDDFIVISGDCVCNFDLKSAFAFHKSNRALSTIVLYSCTDPLEYGLVVTDDSGKVMKFIEKPGWDGVVTNLVNTGIYIMSPRALRFIPENSPYDFGKDFFPDILRQGENIYATESKGYWCDVGSVTSYLDCLRKSLSQKTGIEPNIKQLGDRIWCCSPLPDSTTVIPPVYIGKDVVVGENCHIGPFTCINSGSKIASGCKIEGSVIDGSNIKSGATITGSFIGTGAIVGENSEIREQCAIGDGTSIGHGCTINENVNIWPNRKIPDGSKISENITSGMMVSSLSFGAEASLSGQFGLSITPEAAMNIGSAAASFGKVLVCCQPDGAASLVSDSILCGVRFSGSDGAKGDCPFASAASFTGKNLGFDMTLFVSQSEDTVSIKFMDSLGLPLDRQNQRKIESLIYSGGRRTSVSSVGQVLNICGALDTYAMAAIKSFGQKYPHNMKASVLGHSPEARLLKYVLSQLGFELVSGQKDVFSFVIGPSGELSLIDEDGTELDSQTTMILTCISAFEMGCKELVLPYDGPQVIESIAKKYFARVLRRGGSSQKADSLYSDQLFIRDSIFAAVKIAAYCVASGKTIQKISQSIPSYSYVVREVFLTSDKAAVMHKLSSALSSESALEFDAGIKVKGRNKNAIIRPSFDKNSIIIKTEAENPSEAQALLSKITDMAKN